MTRNQQIESALTLLDPPAQHREACVADIEATISQIQVASAQIASSEDEKRKVKKYRKKVRLSRKKVYPKAHPTVLAAYLDLTAHAVRPLLRGRRDAYLKKTAVAQAHGLLERWGYVPTKTRGKKWDQLSEVLSGETGFLRHMCAFSKLD